MYKLLPLIALVPALGLFGCSSSGDRPTEDIAPIYTIDGMMEVGSSRLTRTNDAVFYELETTGLEPEMAYSLWVLVFNNPQHCMTRPCSEPDLFNPDVLGDIFGDPDAGLITDASGALRLSAGSMPLNTPGGSFGGSRDVGDRSHSLFEVLVIPFPGIVNARAAEIHFVIRSHGPVIDGMEEEMTTTFNGGCIHPGKPFPDPLPPELGAPGPNECMDIQFAAHLP